MIREPDDAVSTFIKTTETPVIPLKAIEECYWNEVAKQVTLLLGTEKKRKLARIISQNEIYELLYRKSEQSRVDLIIMLQRSGKL